MGKIGEPKKIKALTDEQQTYYEGMNARKRAFCDYRSLGYGKKDAYIRAGYKAGATAGQAAYILEKNDVVLAGIIEARARAKLVTDIYKRDTPIEKRIEAAVLDNAGKMIETTIDNATPEVAEQIKFYRDIVVGNVKSKKRTKYVDKAGIVTWKIEESDDVKDKIMARRELDRILGLNKIMDIGSLEVGEININIVDASKKDREDDFGGKTFIKVDAENEIIVETKKGTAFETEDDVIEIDAPPKSEFKRSRG